MFKKQVKCSECGFLGVLNLRGGLHDVFTEWNELSPSDRADLSGAKDAVLFVGCSRGQDHIIAGVSASSKPVPYEALFKNVYLYRRCVYYYPYNPGFTPEQHLELLRERSYRRFLIIVALLSATVGAAIATLVNFIWA